MTKEKSSALIKMARNAADRLRKQARQEERENTLIDHLAAAHKARKAEAAKHTQELENHQKLHVATVAEMAAHHAKTTAELAMRGSAAATDVAAPADPVPAMLISEMAEYVKKAKLTAGDWNEKTADEYMAAANLLIAVIGNKPAGSVTFPDVIEFISTIKKIPPHISKNKKYKGKTLGEIIAMGDKPISPEYVKKRIERVSTFFGFASEKKHSKVTGVEINVFEGESKAAGARPKGKTSRLPFSDSDIASLLYGNETQAKTYNNPYHYWLIPMGLLTGARLNELCQLRLDDIKSIDGVWCIDINNEGEGKRTKTASSVRVVPLHEKLINLGLLQYVEALKSAGHERLFPELKELRDGHGQAASKWFNRHRKECGITAAEKVFHSFRHTFITKLINSGVSDTLISPVVGHGGGEKTQTNTTYFNTGDILARRETTVDKLTHFNEILKNYPAVHEVTLKVNRRDNFWRKGTLLRKKKSNE